MAFRSWRDKNKSSLSSGSDPVAGEFGGQLSNSQPEEPTWPGGKSKEPEPDLFSAGADMITYVWNMIYKEEQERMYVYRCIYVKMCMDGGVLASEAYCRIKRKKQTNVMTCFSQRRVLGANVRCCPSIIV